jgi:hypothetical protein
MNQPGSSDLLTTQSARKGWGRLICCSRGQPSRSASRFQRTRVALGVTLQGWLLQSTHRFRPRCSEGCRRPRRLSAGAPSATSLPGKMRGAQPLRRREAAESSVRQTLFVVDDRLSRTRPRCWGRSRASEEAGGRGQTERAVGGWTGQRRMWSNRTRHLRSRCLVFRSDQRQRLWPRHPGRCLHLRLDLTHPANQSLRRRILGDHAVLYPLREGPHQRGHLRLLQHRRLRLGDAGLDLVRLSDDRPRRSWSPAACAA